MNFSAAILFLSASTAAAASTLEGPMRASANLMKVARRLEDAGDDAQNNEYQFLANYQLKMIGCKADTVYVSPEDGEYEYSSVVFRLCPADEVCSDEGSQGCGAGYGDFVVGINTFVENYLEGKKDDMQGDDDAWNVDQYSECREFEVDQDADEDGDEDEQQQYFVGPSCTSDGSTIKLEFYLDETCQTVSNEVTFEEISNGMALPYETGGLVSNYCESCSGYNDNGEYELSEMCTQLYENSGKCETNMETFSYNGIQEGACEAIAEILPRKAKRGAGKTIGWLFFILVVCGGAAAAYSMMKKRKDDKSFGLMNA